jgi:hypothetical protein
MRKLLENLSREQLLDFIVEYAENDNRLANAINVRFGKPEFEGELKKIENIIDEALYDVSDYRARDSWGYVSIDIVDIIDEIMKRAEQGHIRLAFAEIELLYIKLLKVFEYQEECEISDKAEYCISIMSDIVDKTVSEADKDYFFKRCIELTEVEDGKNYGANYEHELLKIAAKLVTSQNRSELEQSLVRFCSGWHEEKFKLIQLDLIRRFDGKSEEELFIAENLKHPKIREIAYDNAILRKDYAEAERICVDGISTDRRGYGIPTWQYKLYSVYEMAGNIDEMAKTAKAILFKGDLGYYEILKSVLQKQKKWDGQYAILLDECASKLYHSTYMSILQIEQEYELLLEQLKKHTDQIFSFGEYLVEMYPDDICTLFITQIKKEAETVNKRYLYHNVFTRIAKFSKLGYLAEAQELIKELKEINKRSPAFIDELTRIKL